MKHYAYSVLCHNPTTNAQTQHGVVATSVMNAITAVATFDENLEVIAVSRVVEITIS